MRRSGKERSHGQNQPTHRNRARRLPPAGGGSGGAAWRGLHGSVHRPLSQGEDRRARRHATAQARGAPRLPARAGGPARHRFEDHRRARQAYARARPRHQRRRDQDRAGRSICTLQAQAAHQGADRARGRARAVGRCSAQEPRSRPGDGSRQVRRCGKGRRRCQGGAGGRAPYPHRAHCRDADARRQFARMAVGRGRAEILRAQGQG